MKLDIPAPGDMSRWRELDFALNCTYIVPDQVSDPVFSLPKAMTSIPRNLTFEYNKDNEVRLIDFLQYIHHLWRVFLQENIQQFYVAWFSVGTICTGLRGTKDLLTDKIFTHWATCAQGRWGKVQFGVLPKFFAP